MQPFARAMRPAQNDELARHARRTEIFVPPSSNASSGDAPSASLYLTHGFCASNTWPDDDFHDFAYNDEPSKAECCDSLSNDQFAEQILGNVAQKGLRSWGGIGHSQGGLALLHILAHYQSGMDNATEGGPRLVQALSSPFHGTPLMGTIPFHVYTWFFSCTEHQDDLTTDGAERGLATIPNAARAKVWAYQISQRAATSMTYEHSCNRITKCTDDESCNDAVGRGLRHPRGNNEPVPGEWCHSLLRYPGIISNSELNKKMDTWAAEGDATAHTTSQSRGRVAPAAVRALVRAS